MQAIPNACSLFTPLVYTTYLASVSFSRACLINSVSSVTFTTAMFEHLITYTYSNTDVMYENHCVESNSTIQESNNDHSQYTFIVLLANEITSYHFTCHKKSIAGDSNNQYHT